MINGRMLIINLCSRLLDQGSISGSVQVSLSPICRRYSLCILERQAHHNEQNYHYPPTIATHYHPDFSHGLTAYHGYLSALRSVYACRSAIDCKVCSRAPMTHIHLEARCLHRMVEF